MENIYTYIGSGLIQGLVLLQVTSIIINLETDIHEYSLIIYMVKVILHKYMIFINGVHLA